MRCQPGAGGVAMNRRATISIDLPATSGVWVQMVDTRGEAWVLYMSRVPTIGEHISHRGLWRVAGVEHHACGPRHDQHDMVQGSEEAARARTERDYATGPVATVHVEREDAAP